MPCKSFRNALSPQAGQQTTHKKNQTPVIFSTLNNPTLSTRHQPVPFPSVCLPFFLALFPFAFYLFASLSLFLAPFPFTFALALCALVPYVLVAFLLFIATCQWLRVVSIDFRGLQLYFSRSFQNRCSRLIQALGMRAPVHLYPLQYLLLDRVFAPHLEVKPQSTHSLRSP